MAFALPVTAVLQKTMNSPISGQRAVQYRDKTKNKHGKLARLNRVRAAQLNIAAAAQFVSPMTKKN